MTTPGKKVKVDNSWWKNTNKPAKPLTLEAFNNLKEAMNKEVGKPDYFPIYIPTQPRRKVK